MKKIVMSTVVAGVLATNIMAEVKPYIGLSLQSFTINGSGISVKDKTTGASGPALSSDDTGATVGLNGGLLIGDNAKLNFEYFSENSSESLETTVMSISYNYSFNNQGIRRGFYLGAGLSSVKTEIVD
ncbi:MAG: hypothetical protein JJV95_05640, partial [Sulfurospirillum sp.]|nr:hypothetical protein [Sulfurospirillum sp.]